METQEIAALIRDLPKATCPLALLWTQASSPCVEMSRRKDGGDWEGEKEEEEI